MLLNIELVVPFHPLVAPSVLFLGNLQDEEHAIISSLCLQVGALVGVGVHETPLVPFLEMKIHKLRQSFFLTLKVLNLGSKKYHCILIATSVSLTAIWEEVRDEGVSRQCRHYLGRILSLHGDTQKPPLGGFRWSPVLCWFLQGLTDWEELVFFFFCGHKFRSYAQMLKAEYRVAGWCHCQNPGDK